MELLDLILRWVIAPITAFVWLLHRQSQSHATDIAVIKSQQAFDKTAHDREFKQMH